VQEFVHALAHMSAHHIPECPHPHQPLPPETLPLSTHQVWSVAQAQGANTHFGRFPWRRRCCGHLVPAILDDAVTSPVSF
jgi:hypothetical protein